MLREWVDIPIEFEFRGFVYDNKLTALCQYYDEVCYPELLEKKTAIEDAILSFFEQVKDRVPITPKEYVLDFLVDVTQSPPLVKIVEINPFGRPDGMGTGTVMFDLRKEEDQAILFGEAPFQFRVEEVPLSQENYSKMIGPELKAIVRPYEKQ